MYKRPTSKTKLDFFSRVGVDQHTFLSTEEERPKEVKVCASQPWQVSPVLARSSDQTAVGIAHPAYLYKRRLGLDIVYITTFSLAT